MLIEDAFDELELTSNEVTNRIRSACRRKKIADTPQRQCGVGGPGKGLSRPSRFTWNVADELDAAIVSEFLDRGTINQGR